MGLLFIKIWHSQFSKTRFRLIKIVISLKELITKNLEVQDKLNYELNKTFDSYESTFLSRPISLRLWSSFLVILPIFFQAEDGIRDCLLSRGLGDVYKRQN